MALVINFVAFQCGWFAAVLSANIDRPWLGSLAVAAVIALHLARAPRARPELALLLLCGVIGGIWDSLLVHFGWVAYATGNLWPGLAPYWIVAMWMLFATTLNLSLGWLKRKPVLAVAAGLVGGPGSYLAGEKLGGIQLLEPATALAALAVGWGIMLPLLLLLAQRFDGVTVDEDVRQAMAHD